MKNEFKMVGRLDEICPIETHSSDFSSRVIRLNNEFTNEIITFTVYNRNFHELDKASVGDLVTLTFRIKGKYKNKKYFNSLILLNLSKHG
jgi:hypothetical protein